MPDTDTRSLVERLREGTTVLDEPFHHDAIAQAMEEAATALEAAQQKLDRKTEALRITFECQKAAERRVDEVEAELRASGEREERLRAWVNRGLTQMAALMDSDPEAFVRAKCAGEIMDILEAEGANRDPRAAKEEQP